MSEKISLHTGVSKNWLLGHNPRLPTCERDPERPFTQEVFKMTRAEVCAPRLHPLDVRAVQNFLAVAYHRLSDAALQAYSTNKLIYFNYCLSEFLEELERRWPDSRKINTSMDVTQLAAEAAVLFEKVRQEKLRKRK